MDVFTVIKQAGRDHPERRIISVRTPGGKNIPNGGSTSSKVVTVDFQGTVSGPGSHIDLKIDGGRCKPVASPKTIPGLSVGKHTISLRAIDQDGDKDPTAATWTFTVKKGRSGGYPDTWINWVRTLDTGKDVRDGGRTTSIHFKVDFQSTPTDTGRGSYVDFKIDDDPYHAVALPYTFTILAKGEHTIYLKGVDKYGNEDPTPATFSFTIVGNKDNHVTHKDIVGKIEDSEDDVKAKVEDSEQDVIVALEKKLNILEDNISDEHAVQDEQLSRPTTFLNIFV